MLVCSVKECFFNHVFIVAFCRAVLELGLSIVKQYCMKKKFRYHWYQKLVPKKHFPF